jgi:sulfite reductase alpha subunit-like flavoprotein
MLFFGVRRENEDFLYKDQFEESERILKNFELVMAFSRSHEPLPERPGEQMRRLKKQNEANAHGDNSPTLLEGGDGGENGNKNGTKNGKQTSTGPRAGANRKVYVQDKVRLHKRQIKEFVKEGGMIFICGGVSMGKSVKEQIANILTREEFQMMTNKHRIVEELWS